MEDVSKGSNASGKLVIRPPPEEASTSQYTKSSTPSFADYLQHRQAEEASLRTDKVASSEIAVASKVRAVSTAGNASKRVTAPATNHNNHLSKPSGISKKRQQPSRPGKEDKSFFVSMQEHWKEIQDIIEHLDDLHERTAWQQAKNAESLRKLRESIEDRRKQLDQRIVEDAMGGLQLVDEDSKGDGAVPGD